MFLCKFCGGGTRSTALICSECSHENSRGNEQFRRSESIRKRIEKVLSHKGLMKSNQERARQKLTYEGKLPKRYPISQPEYGIEKVL